MRPPTRPWPSWSRSSRRKLHRAQRFHRSPFRVLDRLYFGLMPHDGDSGSRRPSLDNGDLSAPISQSAYTLLSRCLPLLHGEYRSAEALRRMPMRFGKTPFGGAIDAPVLSVGTNRCSGDFGVTNECDYDREEGKGSARSDCSGGAAFPGCRGRRLEVQAFPTSGAAWLGALSEADLERAVTTLRASIEPANRCRSTCLRC
jgi:hypothetical protein